MARAAPFPHGDLGGETLERARQAGLVLLQEQIEYHLDRGRLGKADVPLRVLSRFCFVATVGCIILQHFWSEAGSSIWRSSVLPDATVILPAAATFFFGIRAYAEFELLADQSARMARVLYDAWNEIEKAGFDWPLASQDLAQRGFSERRR